MSIRWNSLDVSGNEEQDRGYEWMLGRGWVCVNVSVWRMEGGGQEEGKSGRLR